MKIVIAGIAPVCVRTRTGRKQSEKAAKQDLPPFPLIGCFYSLDKSNTMCYHYAGDVL